MPVPPLIPPEWGWAYDIAVGQDWPQADEDALRRLAQAWTDAMEGLLTVADGGNVAAQNVNYSVQSVSSDEFNNYWSAYVSGDNSVIGQMARQSESLATQLLAFAEQTEFTKWSIDIQLVLLFIQLVIDLVLAFVTFGASTSEGVLAAFITRLTVRGFLTELIKAVLMAVLPDVITQTIMLAEGHRSSYDVGETLQAAQMGVIGGVVGAGLGAGLGKLGATEFFGSVAGKFVSEDASKLAGGVASAALHGALTNLGTNFAAGTVDQVENQIHAAVDPVYAQELQQQTQDQGYADQKSGQNPLLAMLNGAFTGALFHTVHEGSFALAGDYYGATHLTLVTPDGGQRQFTALPIQDGRGANFALFDESHQLVGRGTIGDGGNIAIIPNSGEQYNAQVLTLGDQKFGPAPTDLASSAPADAPQGTGSDHPQPGQPVTSADHGTGAPAAQTPATQHEPAGAPTVQVEQQPVVLPDQPAPAPPVQPTEPTPAPPPAQSADVPVTGTQEPLGNVPAAPAAAQPATLPGPESAPATPQQAVDPAAVAPAALDLHPPAVTVTPPPDVTGSTEPGVVLVPPVAIAPDAVTTMRSDETTAAAQARTVTGTEAPGGESQPLPGVTDQAVTTSAGEAAADYEVVAEQTLAGAMPTPEELRGYVMLMDTAARQEGGNELAIAFKEGDSEHPGHLIVIAGTPEGVGLPPEYRDYRLIWHTQQGEGPSPPDVTAAKNAGHPFELVTEHWTDPENPGPTYTRTRLFDQAGNEISYPEGEIRGRPLLHLIDQMLGRLPHEPPGPEAGAQEHARPQQHGLPPDLAEALRQRLDSEPMPADAGALDMALKLLGVVPEAAGTKSRAGAAAYVDVEGFKSELTTRYSFARGQDLRMQAGGESLDQGRLTTYMSRDAEQVGLWARSGGTSGVDIPSSPRLTDPRAATWDDISYSDALREDLAYALRKVVPRISRNADFGAVVEFLAHEINRVPPEDLPYSHELWGEWLDSRGINDRTWQTVTERLNSLRERRGGLRMDLVETELRERAPALVAGMTPEGLRDTLRDLDMRENAWRGDQLADRISKQLHIYRGAAEEIARAAQERYQSFENAARDEAIRTLQDVLGKREAKQPNGAALRQVADEIGRLLSRPEQSRTELRRMLLERFNLDKASARNLADVLIENRPRMELPGHSGPRDTDAEAKLVAQIRDTLYAMVAKKADAVQYQTDEERYSAEVSIRHELTGTIVIAPDRPMCFSCQQYTDQLQSEFPGIRVLVGGEGRETAPRLADLPGFLADPEKFTVSEMLHSLAYQIAGDEIVLQGAAPTTAELRAYVLDMHEAAAGGGNEVAIAVKNGKWFPDGKARLIVIEGTKTDVGLPPGYGDYHIIWHTQPREGHSAADAGAALSANHPYELVTEHWTDLGKTYTRTRMFSFTGEEITYPKDAAGHPLDRMIDEVLGGLRSDPPPPGAGWQRHESPETPPELMRAMIDSSLNEVRQLFPKQAIYQHGDEITITTYEEVSSGQRNLLGDPTGTGTSFEIASEVRVRVVVDATAQTSAARGEVVIRPGSTADEVTRQLARALGDVYASSNTESPGGALKELDALSMLWNRAEVFAVQARADGDQAAARAWADEAVRLREEFRQQATAADLLQHAGNPADEARARRDAAWPGMSDNTRRLASRLAGDPMPTFLPGASYFKEEFNRLDSLAYYLETFGSPDEREEFFKEVLPEVTSQDFPGEFKKTYKEFLPSISKEGPLAPEQAAEALRRTAEIGRRVEDASARVVEWAQRHGIFERNGVTVDQAVAIGEEEFRRSYERTTARIQRILAEVSDEYKVSLDYVGSMRSGARGPHKGGVHANLDDFDLDLFIVDRDWYDMEYPRAMTFFPDQASRGKILSDDPSVTQPDLNELNAAIVEKIAREFRINPSVAESRIALRREPPPPRPEAAGIGAMTEEPRRNPIADALNGHGEPAFPAGEHHASAPPAGHEWPDGYRELTIPGHPELDGRIHVNGDRVIISDNPEDTQGTERATPEGALLVVVHGRGGQAFTGRDERQVIAVTDLLTILRSAGLRPGQDVVLACCGAGRDGGAADQLAGMLPGITVVAAKPDVWADHQNGGLFPATTTTDNGMPRPNLAEKDGSYHPDAVWEAHRAGTGTVALTEADRLHPHPPAQLDPTARYVRLAASDERSRLFGTRPPESPAARVTDAFARQARAPDVSAGDDLSGRWLLGEVDESRTMSADIRRDPLNGGLREVGEDLLAKAQRLFPRSPFTDLLDRARAQRKVIAGEAARVTERETRVSDLETKLKQLANPRREQSDDEKRTAMREKNTTEAALREARSELGKARHRLTIARNDLTKMMDDPNAGVKVQVSVHGIPVDGVWGKNYVQFHGSRDYPGIVKELAGLRGRAQDFDSRYARALVELAASPAGHPGIPQSLLDLAGDIYGPDKVTEFMAKSDPLKWQMTSDHVATFLHDAAALMVLQVQVEGARNPAALVTNLANWRMVAEGRLSIEDALGYLNVMGPRGSVHVAVVANGPDNPVDEPDETRQRVAEMEMRQRQILALYAITMQHLPIGAYPTWVDALNGYFYGSVTAHDAIEQMLSELVKTELRW